MLLLMALPFICRSPHSSNHQTVQENNDLVKWWHQIRACTYTKFGVGIFKYVYAHQGRFIWSKYSKKSNCVKYKNLKNNLSIWIYLLIWKVLNFQQPLLQFSVSHDPLEIIIIMIWCSKTFLIIINFENSYTAFVKTVISFLQEF